MSRRLGTVAEQAARREALTNIRLLRQLTPSESAEEERLEKALQMRIWRGSVREHQLDLERRTPSKPCILCESELQS